MSKNMLGVFSEKDIQELTKVIEKLEESQFDFMEIENDSMKIVIGKNGVAQESVSNISDITSSSNKTAAATKLGQEIIEEPETAQEKSKEEKPEPVSAAEDEVLIKANTAGIYYAQSEPGAPPYVQIGDQVEEDTTVGLIEVMKVFSAIQSGVSGVITAIHVENGELVEYGQPLFTVKTN